MGSTCSNDVTDFRTIVWVMMAVFTGMIFWVFLCFLKLWGPRVTLIDLQRKQRGIWGHSRCRPRAVKEREQLGTGGTGVERNYRG